MVVFAKGDKVDEAKAAGADEVGGPELAEKIKGGWTDFDVCIAAPDMMGVVGPLGKVLGPRGLMPSPRAGTVTPDVGKVVREYKAGKVEFRNDAGGNVHAVVGKLSFDAPKLAENIAAFIHHVTQPEAGLGPRAVRQGDLHQCHDEPRHSHPARALNAELSQDCMSKFVKNLITDHLRGRLQGVNDALLVNVVGMDANTNHRLRGELRRKNIHLLVVKNSLAAPGHGGDAAGRPVRGVAGCGGRSAGARRHRQPGQGNHQADRQRQVQAAGGPRRRDGRPAAHRPRRWPRSASGPAAREQLSLLVGPDPRPGRQAGRAS